MMDLSELTRIAELPPELREHVVRQLSVELAKAEWELEKLKEEVERERERWHLERERLETELAKLRHEATAARIQAEREEREWRDKLRLRDGHREFVMVGEINDQSVAAAISALETMHHLYPGEPLRLVIRSHGGLVLPGLHLHDYIVGLRARGVHVTTHAAGAAESMAAVILQAGTERTASPNAWLLLHEVGIASVGKLSEVEDMDRWARALMERIIDIFVSRAQGTNAPRRLTRQRFWKLVRRRDCWLSAQEALQWGLIDRIEPDGGETIVSREGRP